MGKVARAIRSLISGGTPLRCIHCSRPRADVKYMISGPGVYVCGDCAREAAQTFAAGTTRTAFGACSFCGNTARTVELGPERTRAVCGDCIELMEHILEEADHRDSLPQ